MLLSLSAMGPSSRTPTRDAAIAASSAPTVDLPKSALVRDTADIATTKVPMVGRPRSKTTKPTSQQVKPLSKPPVTGGVYSMTNKPSERVSSARLPESKPVSFQVSADASGAVRLDIDGRVLTLTRREARTLADKLLRAVK